MVAVGLKKKEFATDEKGIELLVLQRSSSMKKKKVSKMWKKHLAQI